MQNPKVKFVINPKADIENCLYFVKYNHIENPEYIKWFLPKELYFVLNDKFSQKERGDILKEYTKRIFEFKNKN